MHPHQPAGIGLRQAHVAELLARRPALGFVEVHSENYFGAGGAALATLDAARAHWPVSLHGVGLGLGSACGLDTWHLDKLAALVARVDPVRVSDHAAFCRAPRHAGGPVLHGADLLPVAFTEASLALMVRQVMQVQDRLRRPLLVENISAYVAWADDTLAEPDYFNALCRQTGCGLLLDLNNLVVNALNCGSADPAADACRWVDQIDAHSVGEIHLAGYNDSGALVIDDHGSQVREGVWQVYRHTLRRLGARPTLIEWDTALPVLDALLAEAAKADAVASSVVAA
ncbi:MAG: DUF692 domain-containing protein [Vitreoscilla sp.]|nr:DUF692 domain-containing protein [Burkholderiales bacterium]MBP6336638.1 DUF692 domain-containing protein [Vitreoscilla sp.]MBP6675209.1 DUF692 domain-containing protein [Vitreoscilla sp.]